MRDINSYRKRREVETSVSKYIRHHDFVPWITKDKRVCIRWGVFTGSNNKGGFSPALTHVEKVLLRTMKSTLGHNLGMKVL